jgi:hypothetical protein
VAGFWNVFRGGGVRVMGFVCLGRVGLGLAG